MNQTPEQIAALALDDLQRLLGITGKPSFADVKIIDRSIPQYNVGYGAVKDLIEGIEARCPGLFFAGNFRDGISVSDCIAGGSAAAEKVAAARPRNAELQSVSLASPRYPCLNKESCSSTWAAPIPPPSPTSAAIFASSSWTRRVIDVPYLVRFALVNGIVAPFRARQSAEAPRRSGPMRARRSSPSAGALPSPLQEELGIHVGLAMRYQKPGIAEAIQKLSIAGVRRLVVIPLFPHYATSSYESAVVKVETDCAEIAPWISLSVMPPYFDHRLYIDSLVAIARPYFNPGHHLLFSFHGIPERHILKADPSGCHCLKVQDCCSKPSPAHETCYRRQCLATVNRFAAVAGARSRIL